MALGSKASPNGATLPGPSAHPRIGSQIARGKPSTPSPKEAGRLQVPSWRVVEG